MFPRASGARTRGERPRFRRDIFCARQRVRRVEQREHARVFDAIVHAQAIFPIFDQPGLTEERQLLGNIRLTLPQERSQMTNTFFASAERVEQAQARGMRERAEQLGGLTIWIHRV